MTLTRPIACPERSEGTPDPRPSRRGGRRPGAGAPKGNMNALRSGKRSKRVLAMKLALQALPQAAGALKGLANGGDDRIVLYARALHYCADLIVLGAGFDQSKIAAANQPLQLHEIRRLFPTISQSNGHASGLLKELENAQHIARTAPLPKV